MDPFSEGFTGVRLEVIFGHFRACSIGAVSQYVMTHGFNILFHPLPLPFRDEFWLRIEETTPN